MIILTSMGAVGPAGEAIEQPTGGKTDNDASRLDVTVLSVPSGTWIEGERASVGVTVLNRGAHEERAEVTVSLTQDSDEEGTDTASATIGSGEEKSFNLTLSGHAGIYELAATVDTVTTSLTGEPSDQETKVVEIYRDLDGPPTQYIKIRDGNQSRQADGSGFFVDNAFVGARNTTDANQDFGSLGTQWIPQGHGSTDSWTQALDSSGTWSLWPAYEENNDYGPYKWHQLTVKVD